MKTRSGFVSNSSSASFIVSVPQPIPRVPMLGLAVPYVEEETRDSTYEKVLWGMVLIAGLSMIVGILI